MFPVKIRKEDTMPLFNTSKQEDQSEESLPGNFGKNERIQFRAQLSWIDEITFQIRKRN